MTNFSHSGPFLVNREIVPGPGNNAHNNITFCERPACHLWI